MFTCPRCGAHTFRTTRYDSGLVERSCTGAITERPMAVAKFVKGAKPRAYAPVLDAPMRHTRACAFLWTPERDAELGVTAEDLSQEVSMLALATTSK